MDSLNLKVIIVSLKTTIFSKPPLNRGLKFNEFKLYYSHNITWDKIKLYTAGEESRNLLFVEKFRKSKWTMLFSFFDQILYFFTALSLRCSIASSEPISSFWCESLSINRFVQNANNFVCYYFSSCSWKVGAFTKLTNRWNYTSVI